MGFLNYLVRRLALVLPTLFGVSLICFFLTYMLPGNPAMVKAGPFATAEHLAEMEHQMGLDRSLPEQYVRYVTGLVPWRPRREFVDRAPGIAGFHPASPRDPGIESCRPSDRDRDRHSAWRVVGRPPRHLHRPYRARRRNHRGGDAQLLDRSAFRLRVLLSAERRAAATRPPWVRHHAAGRTSPGSTSWIRL